MHSCIRLYNAQHCSFIGQISVVLDSIVYDTWMLTFLFFEFFFLYFYFKQSVSPATVIFLQNMQGPFWTSPDWISYWKSNSHLNNEIELFFPLITWSLRGTSAEQQIAAPRCTVIFQPSKISARLPEQLHILFGSLPDFSVYCNRPSPVSAPLLQPYTSWTCPIGERVKYPWPCQMSFPLWTRIDSYICGVQRERVSVSGLPDVLDITEACQLCGCGSKWVTLLDITQLLHNDPTVLLILQHTRWLTMKVRQMWTACIRE